MSSRAKRVSQQAEPFAWIGGPPPSSARAQSHVGTRVDEPTGRPHAGEQPAEVSLEELERSAFARGRAEGLRAGADAANRQAEATSRRIEQTIKELNVLKGEIVHQTERQVVELAMAIAHRILQRQLTMDRSLLLAMARVALDRLGEQTAATIRLHPDDYALVTAGSDLESAGGTLRIVADPVVSRGGCVVQTDFGQMDASLDGQFRELARVLLGDVDPGPHAVPASKRHDIAA
jgi:flagellar assembly protein FliH